MSEQENLRFLCQVVQDLQNNKYRVLVNSEDMLSLPEKTVQSEKIVVSENVLPVGSSILCSGSLNTSTRQVQVHSYLLVSSSNIALDDKVELEPEVLLMVESLDSTPKDLMDTIYAEELEEDEEEDAELSDTEDEE